MRKHHVPMLYNCMENACVSNKYNHCIKTQVNSHFKTEMYCMICTDRLFKGCDVNLEVNVLKS